MLSGRKNPYRKGESDSILALSLAGEIVRFPPKRRQGYRWAGLLSFEKDWIRVPTSSPKGEGNTAGRDKFASGQLALRSLRTRAR